MIKLLKEKVYSVIIYRSISRTYILLFMNRQTHKCTKKKMQHHIYLHDGIVSYASWKTCKS